MVQTKKQELVQDCSSLDRLEDLSIWLGVAKALDPGCGRDVGQAEVYSGS